MELTNDACIIMYNALSAVEQPRFEDIKNLDDREEFIFHTDFVFAVSFNKRKLKDIVDSLQESTKNTKEYDEYLDKREKILQKHSVKTDSGAPMERREILPGGQQRSLGYIVPDMADDNSVVSKAIAKLEKTNDAHIKHREKQNDEFKVKAKEKADIEIKKVRWSQIPRGLQPFMMDGVMFMIDEESDKQKENKKN